MEMELLVGRIMGVRGLSWVNVEISMDWIRLMDVRLDQHHRGVWTGWALVRLNVFER
jgi:hypothetical protein